ncbi:MAG: glycosyltransferase [Gammaproteobacteria bacterium]|nr:glycosyltransferase [Gammaproteobacteria bacterium]
MQLRAFAIFAYNEKVNIISCIKSVQRECDDNIYVLINGCSDNTQQIVEDYAREYNNVKPVVIAVGDKSNAWNVFVHELAIKAQMYYFLDGDCCVIEGFIDKMEKQGVSDSFNAISATPIATTPSRKKTITAMLEEHGLAGNFYALSSFFIERIREKNIKLPIGIIGEDGLVGALAKWNLEPSQGWNNKKIQVLVDANFDYEPLSIFTWSDLKLYYRRNIRYSSRYFQNKIISEAFKREGLQWLSGNVEQLYLKYPEKLKLSWRGINTFFDWLALREIKSLSK